MRRRFTADDTARPTAAKRGMPRVVNSPVAAAVPQHRAGDEAALSQFGGGSAVGVLTGSN